jgi:hypothetical protein
MPGPDICFGPSCLKGQWHEIFCFWFFSCIIFSPAQDYSIRTVSFFSSQIRRGDIRKSRCTAGGNFSTSFASVVNTGGKFATGVNDTGAKQWEQLSNF